VKNHENGHKKEAKEQFEALYRDALNVTDRWSRKVQSLVRLAQEHNRIGNSEVRDEIMGRAIDACAGYNRAIDGMVWSKYANDYDDSLSDIVVAWAEMGELKKALQMLDEFSTEANLSGCIWSLKDEIDKECIIDYVEHIAEKDYSEYVRGEFVHSILDWLLERMDMVPSVLPLLQKHIIRNQEILEKSLYLGALYERYFSENHQPEKMNFIRHIAALIEKENILLVNTSDAYSVYSFSKMDQWISDIQDEDDREQIELWAKRVEKGKLTEAEFEQKVRKHLS